MSKREYTAEEWEVLEFVAKSRGWEFAQKNARLILEQARTLGELAEAADEPVVVDNGDVYLERLKDALAEFTWCDGRKGGCQ